MLANFVTSPHLDGSAGSGGGSTSIGGMDSGGSAANSHQQGGNAGGGGASMGDQQNNEIKRSLQPPYSMPGVLHYVQHEWSRYELERAQWEMERAELKARISFLMGERKAQENLKHDLVRRIKMLEYVLKQERVKFKQMEDEKGGGEDKQNGSAGNDDDRDAGEAQGTATVNVKSEVPLDIDAILPPTNSVSREPSQQVNMEWAKARETLRQYLQEIGYTEKILDVRSFRVKSLLGLVPLSDGGVARGVGSAEGNLIQSEQAILEAADAIKKSRGSGHSPQSKQQRKKSPRNKRGKCQDGEEEEEDSDSSSGGDGEAGLDADAVEAFNEFSFLKSAMDGGGKGTGKPMGGGQAQGKESLDVMKERLRTEQERRRQQSLAQGKQTSKEDSSPQQHPPAPTSKMATSPGKARNISVDTVHGIPPNTLQPPAAEPFEEEKFEGVKTGSEEDEEEQAKQLRWNIRYTLRSHYDPIRAMQFHPVEPVLITASEDGTAKLWDLNHSAVAGSGKGEGSAKANQLPQPTTGIVDIEPVYTFRGHRGPILAMELSPLGENCYTAGLDGQICCWTVPSVAGMDIYQNFDPNALQERLTGHTNSIWSLCFHSASNRLISASSDGTIRIWIVGLADGAMPSPLLRTIAEVERPHSIDLVSTESQQLLCACAKAKCHIRDLETGQIVAHFRMDEGGEDTPPGELNKILSHPTMPVTITAGEDRKIRFFDNNTGRMISSTMAHMEGVSTLAIDPNGLYMLSGSHDGSVRLWNAEKRICLQEIAAHRKKLGSGVMTVAFHPSRQLIGSAGADSLAKVYGTVRTSPRGSLIASASPPSSSGSSGHSSLVGSPQKQQLQQHIASSQL